MSPAGHAHGPGPLRARLHHLHADRLGHAVGRGAGRGPDPGAGAVRRRLPACPAPAVPLRRSNAQEAHEAIRPGRRPVADPGPAPGRAPGADLRLYDLVWKRTLASQMADAVGKTVSVRIDAAPLATAHGCTITEWAASGRPSPSPATSGSTWRPRRPRGRPRRPRAAAARPGRRAGAPRPGGRPRGVAPPNRRPATPRRRWSSGWRRPASAGRPPGRRSCRPSRTAATCGRRAPPWCRRGRPSPWSSRWRATSPRRSTTPSRPAWRTSSTRSPPAPGTASRSCAFWFGNGARATTLIDHAMANADPAVVNAIPLGKDADGELIVVRNGRYGPYVKRSEDTASVPADLPPDELTVARALEILAAPRATSPSAPTRRRGGRWSRPAGSAPMSNWATRDTLPTARSRRCRCSRRWRPPTSRRRTRFRPEPARTVGTDAGEEIVALNGRYGPISRRARRPAASPPRTSCSRSRCRTHCGCSPSPSGGGGRRAALRELGTTRCRAPVVIREGRYGLRHRR